MTLASQSEPGKVTRFSDPYDPLLTTNDFVKSIYMALLDAFPVEESIGFWKALPMVMGGRTLSPSEVVRHIWREKAKVPIAWDYGIGEALEAFLVVRNVSIESFYAKILFRNNRSTYLPGRFLLKWCYPIMKNLGRFDLRDVPIRLTPLFTENLCPLHIHRRIKKTVRPDWVESVMIYITDRTFADTVYFDCETHSGEQVKASPGILGLPAYEEFRILSDCRPLKVVVWSGVVEERTGLVFIDGAPVAHMVDFAAHCRSLDIDVSEFGIPVRICVLMDVDYRCPVRKRIVLHAGAVYDAPVYLHTVGYRRMKYLPNDVLDHMIFDLDDGEVVPLVEKVSGKHAILLEKIRETAYFRFFSGEESMSLNGLHFTKGIPAKILKYLMETYLKEGKSEFEYRELKRLFEISQGQKNSNFEVRLYRLIEKLKDECPSFRVEKTGRGRFKVIINGKLEFQES